MGKPYGAERDYGRRPPLRIRLRRFHEDCRAFQAAGWPVLRYESLLEQPEATLRSTCADLKLPWDDGMLSWPKAVREIADAQWGNDTFWTTRGETLAQTLANHASRQKPLAIAQADLEWLDGEFGEYNRQYGYPLHVGPAAAASQPAGGEAPSFQVTRRYEWETHRKPVRWLLDRIGPPNRRLIERRSLKRCA